MREHATESRLSEHLLFCAFNALVTCCPVLLRSRKSDVGKKKEKKKKGKKEKRRNCEKYRETNIPCEFADIPYDFCF